MDLLDVVRGPALVAAITIFVLGTLWRLIHLLRLPRLPDLSPAHADAPSKRVGAGASVVRGLWPRPAFARRTLFVTLNGYVFHLGLALIFFGYAPHIAFVHRITGFAWPALPDPVMYCAAGATLVAMGLALAWRLTDPVRKMVSNADDFVTWALVFLPVMTGMAVLAEPSVAMLARDHVIYRGPVAVHLITCELLLVWFPFGKLMHAFWFVLSRGATGVRFSHRGVKA